MVKEMDMDLRKMIWKLTDRQVTTQLREAGIDARPTLDKIEKLLAGKLHHEEEDARRIHHLHRGGMTQKPIYVSEAA